MKENFLSVFKTTKTLLMFVLTFPTKLNPLVVDDPVLLVGVDGAVSF